MTGNRRITNALRVLAAAVFFFPLHAAAQIPDTTPPVSHVLPFDPDETTSEFFEVAWTGSDEGSGIKDYTIYVSDNGGPFTIWLENIISPKAATYVGEPGHTYSFYSIARDVALNVEPAKSAGEATITVLAAPPVHPADANHDWRMTINEVTAYGLAWKRGDTWPTAPNPIPINYVTNAGSLWKTGEFYHYDSTKTAPLCWVVGSN